MHEIAFLNNQYFKVSEATLSAISSATLYGKGIFTTIAIYDGEPFLWEKHWRRLTENAAKLGIDLSEHSENTTRKALDEIVGKNGVTSGRARITFFDNRPSTIWPAENESALKTSLHIMTGDLRPVPDDVNLTVSPYPINSRSPLAGVKSCNYLENLMAFDEAKGRGFNEAIRLNERGEVTSACMANVFWLNDDRLYTPSLTTGCLAGTTREFVLENLECEEVETGIEAINAADAIFLTSAGIGVAALNELDGIRVVNSAHEITSLVSAARDAG